MTSSLAIRRWWTIMPIVFITYSLAYLDRANFGFASAAGINQDLGISKGLSSLIGALFFLGYFFFQIPGAIYAERRSVKKLVFWSLILWGGCAALTGMVSNIPSLMVIRFVLGVVEAAVMPAMLIFISNWFTKRERSRANTFLILGNPVTVLWMSVVSGYLVHSFGWRQMFIAEGAPAIIWAICWWFIVQDKPQQVSWLTQQQKDDLAETLRAEQAAIKPVRNYSEAFRTPAVIKLCAQYFCWSIGVYGFVLWLPSILKNGSSLGMVETGWLSALPYLAATIAMLAASWASDKLNRRKVFVWPFLLIGAVGVRGVVRARLHAFLALVRIAGDRGRRDVRAVWSVLRDRAGTAAEERRGRRDGADQQHGRARFVRRLVCGRLSERRHRLAIGIVCIHERGAARRRDPDADRQAATAESGAHARHTLARKIS